MTKHVKITVVVPSTHDHVPVADSHFDQRVETVETALSERFGGATSVDGFGSWVSDDGDLVRERVKLVFTFAQPSDEEVGELRGVVSAWQAEWKQDCVLFTVEPVIEVSFV